jgi:hypothetical protein
MLARREKSIREPPHVAALNVANYFLTKFDYLLRNMKTENNFKVRPLTHPRSAELNDYAEFVEEIIRFGSQLLGSLMKSDYEPISRLAHVALLRHSLEILDPIPGCVKYGMIDSTKLNLRALFDTWLIVLYICEIDSDRRAMAFQYFSVLAKVKRMRRQDPDTGEGKRFISAHKGDRIIGNANNDENNLEGLRKQIAEQEMELSLECFKEIHEEYQKLKAEKKSEKAGKIEWYSLFAGPKNMELLAKHLHLSGMYEMFFRRYSGKVHPADLIYENVFILPDNTGIGILPLRRSGKCSEIAPLFFQISLEIFNKLNNKFKLISGEGFADLAKNLNDNLRLLLTAHKNL